MTARSENQHQRFLRTPPTAGQLAVVASHVAPGATVNAYLGIGTAITLEQLRSRFHSWLDDALRRLRRGSTRSGRRWPLPSMSMEVEVIRSKRRRRTGQARVVDGVIHVAIPAGLPKGEEERLVSDLVAKIRRKRSAEPIDLAARCEVLAARYGLPQPATVRWVDNQVSRWGSCTPVDRSIRISTRLAAFPSWVLDAVLVHELAHLVVPGHDRDFWELANRYPKMERARGFLIAKGLEEGEEGDDRGAIADDQDDPPAPMVRPPRVKKPQQHTLF